MTRVDFYILAERSRGDRFLLTCRLLEKYVQEQGVLSLPQAISRMTARPAQRLGLKDRGLIREGMKADITIFDLERIHERGTFREPNQYPEGIVHVLVNGEQALKEGELTGFRKGRVLKKG